MILHLSLVTMSLAPTICTYLHCPECAILCSYNATSPHSPSKKSCRSGQIYICLNYSLTSDFFFKFCNWARLHQIRRLVATHPSFVHVVCTRPVFKIVMTDATFWTIEFCRYLQLSIHIFNNHKTKLKKLRLSWLL